MNISQRLRTCAKHTGLDAVIELLQEAADEIDALQARAILTQQPDNASCKSVQKRLEVQQPATGEPVLDVRCEGCGYMTHHREHMGCVRAAKQHTHPAPSVPADVMRDAERYRFIRDADISDDLIPDVALYALESLDEYIDAAMLAAK